MNYGNASTHCKKVISKVKVFKNISNSMVTGWDYWYPRKGLVTNKTHVKYQSSGTVQKLPARLTFSKNWLNFKFVW